MSKILIVRLGALGDILHTIPVQQWALEAHPGLEIHWLAEPRYAPLLAQVPGLRRLWLADTKGWRRRPFPLPEIFRLVRELREQAFDLALDFQGLVKSAWLARASGARRVYGFRAERFKEGLSSPFYHRRISGEADPNCHVILSNARLMQAAGLGGKGQPRALVTLQIPAEVQERVRDFLGRQALRRPVLISPGAGWVTKLWPPSQWARLLLELRRQMGLSPLLVYGPGEEPLAREILRQCPLEIPAWRCDLLELAELCRSAALLLGGDTGPLHLAVAMGTPTVALLGPTSPRRNGPFCPQDEIVHRLLPCSHCYRRTCDKFICMNLPVQAVLDAVRRRLRCP